MAVVKNNHSKTPIGLPDGATIRPGESLEVADWDELVKRKNLAFYVESGTLSVEKAKTKAEDKK